MTTIGTPEGLSDEPRDLRAEDAFDIESLQQWLHRHVPGMTVENPHVRQFPGGASNLTYLLSYPDREVILRRPPAGTKAASAHDMKREFTIQDRLRPAFPQVPTVLALCT
ncbi:MAG: phosphotransferase, partial [Candidatus Nanopelagicales bacterium]